MFWKTDMPIRIDSRSADFASQFAAFLTTKREVSADIEAATRAIVDDVAARGDAALLEATRKYDRLQIDAAGLRITRDEIAAAIEACDAATLDALKLARDRIEAFHRRQLPKDDRYREEGRSLRGSEAGERAAHRGNGDTGQNQPHSEWAAAD